MSWLWLVSGVQMTACVPVWHQGFWLSVWVRWLSCLLKWQGLGKASSWLEWTVVDIFHWCLFIQAEMFAMYTGICDYTVVRSWKGNIRNRQWCCFNFYCVSTIITFLSIFIWNFRINIYEIGQRFMTHNWELKNGYNLLMLFHEQLLADPS